MPHRVLRVHRGGAVGRPDHLQDAPQLHRAPGHAQLGAQLRPHLRDGPRRLPVLHARHGQRSQDVPSQVSHVQNQNVVRCSNFEAIFLCLLSSHILTEFLE